MTENSRKFTKCRSPFAKKRHRPFFAREKFARRMLMKSTPDGCLLGYSLLATFGIRGFATLVTSVKMMLNIAALHINLI